MEPIFRSELALVDGTIGKLVICLVDDALILRGAMAAHQIASTADLRAFNAFSGTEMWSLVGKHEEIPGDGVILGGNEALYRGGRLLIRRYSSKFGSLHPDVIRRCLSPDISVEHQEIWSLGFTDESLPTLASWLEDAMERALKRREAFKARYENYDED